VVVGEERELYELRVQELREFTAEPGLAQGLITLRFLDQLLEILSVARQTGVDPLRVGQAYYQASSLLQVSWLRQALAGLDAENGWDRRAAQVLADDLGRALHTLVGGLVAESSADHAVDAALGRLTEGPVGIAYLDALAEIQGEDSAGLAALMVAVREIQVLAAHG
jgi:glutamate dehydrogenase